VRTPREAGVFVHRAARLLVLRRIEDGYWHIVAGVVEPKETFEEAARRELSEEVGLQTDLVDLEHAVSYPITDELRSQYGYPADVSQVTVRHYAAEAPEGWEPRLNEEHDIYRWSTVDEAVTLFHWPETREAARTVGKRLRRES
jgi:8-oxo-dGTP pyrophosphatase MutT (NUDIX family)